MSAFEAGERKLLAVIGDEEEPVAAPGDIAVDAADAGDVERDGGGAAIAGDVADGGAAIGVEARFDGAAVGVDAADAGADAAQVGEGDHEADGAVAAHVEEADVIEEDHAGLAGGVVRLAEQGADDGVVAARLIDDGGADVIEVRRGTGRGVPGRAAAEIGAAGNDDAGGLAAGVGIDDADAAAHLAPLIEHGRAERGAGRDGGANDAEDFVALGADDGEARRAESRSRGRFPAWRA